MAGLEAGLGLWEEVVDEEAEIAVLPTTDEGTSTPWTPTETYRNQAESLAALPTETKPKALPYQHQADSLSLPKPS